MKAFRILQSGKGWMHWIRSMMFTGIIMLLSALVGADDRQSEEDRNQIGKQIQIVADKLITNNAEKYAEFSGDVHARQGNFMIRSEHLRIYYKDNIEDLKDQTNRQDLVKRIVASGGVKISSDQYTAETERVEYDLDTTVLVLEGEDSTITKGNNFITGSKITIHRKDGQIVVERGTETRVKARFYSKDVQKEK